MCCTRAAALRRHLARCDLASRWGARVDPGLGFCTRQFAIYYHLPLRNNLPLLEWPAPLEWARRVVQVVHFPPLELVPLDGNSGEYGAGSVALLLLLFPLLKLQFFETSR